MQQWVIPIIVVIIVAGGWISNIVKQVHKQNEKRRRMEMGEEQGDRDTTRVRLDQLAQRRLAEAQRQMAQRRASRGASSDSGPEPSNLTMAERIARAKAKAAYERRTQGMAQSRAQSRSADAGGQDTEAARRRALTQARARAQAEQARRQQEAADEARRQAQRTREIAQQQHKRRETELARRRAQQQRAQAARRSAPQRRRQRAQQATSGHGSTPRVKSTEIGSGLASPKDRKNAIAGSPVGIAASVFRDLRGDRDSLRRAIVLKEVLDQPVAMRDPLAQVPGNAR